MSLYFVLDSYLFSKKKGCKIEHQCLPKSFLFFACKNSGRILNETLQIEITIKGFLKQKNDHIYGERY